MTQRHLAVAIVLVVWSPLAMGLMPKTKQCLTWGPHEYNETSKYPTFSSYMTSLGYTTSTYRYENTSYANLPGVCRVYTLRNCALVPTSVDLIVEHGYGPSDIVGEVYNYMGEQARDAALAAYLGDEDHKYQFMNEEEEWENGLHQSWRGQGTAKLYEIRVSEELVQKWAKSACLPRQGISFLCSCDSEGAAYQAFWNEVGFGYNCNVNTSQFLSDLEGILSRMSNRTTSGVDTRNAKNAWTHYHNTDDVAPKISKYSSTSGYTTLYPILIDLGPGDGATNVGTAVYDGQLGRYMAVFEFSVLFNASMNPGSGSGNWYNASGKLDVDNASPYGEHDFNPAWYVDWIAEEIWFWGRAECSSTVTVTVDGSCVSRLPSRTVSR